ncbi:MAG: aminomethyl-transferring glycine dehydrogenase subunit GcvPA [Candidatus Pacebacteria bacterium]|nr:aminomethyl-transferring glycine dehydrogenase subunit GcvPA [Candidatus Paceibacterota bacterium]
MNTTTKPFGYNTHRESDRKKMLKKLGMSSIADLFKQIPSEVIIKRKLNLPDPLPEWQLEAQLRSLAEKNSTVLDYDSYLGGGAYQHHIPAVCDAVVGRSEFLTAYTPYQPEMSQGLLQALFEFQKMMAAILGLPAVNSSVYDGATALAESATMLCRANNNKKILMAENVLIEWQEVINTYTQGRGIELIKIQHNLKTGQIDIDELENCLKKGSAAGFLVQSPNVFGVIEDIKHIAEVCHQYKTLLSVSSNPIALGKFEAPGKLGADIVSCETQPLGIPLNAGGPYLGSIATRKKFEKYLPGRIVGQTTDIKGKRAFVLIKESREQHVAREQATSNICTNQALLAVRAAVFLASLGEEGFKKFAEINYIKAHYLAKQITKISGVRLLKTSDFFNEFLVALPINPEKFFMKMKKKKIFPGIYRNIKSKHTLLIAVTEVKSKEQLDYMANAFNKCLTKNN